MGLEYCFYNAKTFGWTITSSTINLRLLSTVLFSVVFVVDETLFFFFFQKISIVIECLESNSFRTKITIQSIAIMIKER